MMHKAFPYTMAKAFCLLSGVSFYAVSFQASHAREKATLNTRGSEDQVSRKFISGQIRPLGVPFDLSRPGGVRRRGPVDGVSGCLRLCSSKYYLPGSLSCVYMPCMELSTSGRSLLFTEEEPSVIYHLRYDRHKHILTTSWIRGRVSPGKDIYQPRFRDRLSFNLRISSPLDLHRSAKRNFMLHILEMASKMIHSQQSHILTPPIVIGNINKLAERSLSCRLMILTGPVPRASDLIRVPSKTRGERGK